MSADGGSGSGLRTFVAVLAALLVFGGIVLGHQAWQDERREDRCLEQVDGTIDRDNGGVGLEWTRTARTGPTFGAAGAVAAHSRRERHLPARERT